MTTRPVHIYAARRIVGRSNVVTIRASGMTAREVWDDAMWQARMKLGTGEANVALRYQVTEYVKVNAVELAEAAGL